MILFYALLFYFSPKVVVFFTTDCAMGRPQDPDGEFSCAVVIALLFLVVIRREAKMRI